MKNIKNIKLAKKELKEIPIFMATDNNYIPFVETTIRSMQVNASKKYKYVINVLNTGLNEEKVKIVKKLQNENFEINFVDVSKYVEPIKILFIQFSP